MEPILFVTEPPVNDAIVPDEILQSITIIEDSVVRSNELEDPSDDCLIENTDHFGLDNLNESESNKDSEQLRLEKKRLRDRIRRKNMSEEAKLIEREKSRERRKTMSEEARERRRINDKKLRQNMSEEAKERRRLRDRERRKSKKMRVGNTYSLIN